MSYAHLIEKLPEELRFPMLELVEGVEETMREQLAVRRQDFVELKVAVGELAQAQARTEAAVRELAEAQKHTDDRLTRFEKSLHASISALGARWGIRTEDSFRNAIQGIVSEFTDLQVEHFSIFDPAGEVFGRPDQVEIDVVIRNGQTIIGEIKSSISRGDVHLFDRKVKFYERLRGVNVSRKMIITPMLDYRARTLVDELGITVYSSAYDFAEQP